MQLNRILPDRKIIFLWGSLALVLCFALLAAHLLGNQLIFPISLVVISIGLVLAVKPKWVFYLFMLFFVFGEVNFGEYFVQISFSNFFTILVGGIITVYALMGGSRFRSPLRSPQPSSFLTGLLLLFMWGVLSAVINSSYRALLTGLSHVISVLMIFLIVRNHVDLYKGFRLGIVSVGMLSALTILNGLGLISTGYRALASWGSTPWESYIPRSIGLPDMQGGLHSIYILSLLPLAFLLVVNSRKLRLNFLIGALSMSASLLGVLALLIASYRSGWLGLAVSIFCLVWLDDRTLLSQPYRKALLWIILLCMLTVVILQFGDTIFTGTYNLLFNIRSQGVDARILQNQYVLERMTSPSIHLLFGYGYEDFGNTFMAYFANTNNPELYPWLHNYYLGTLYAIGWPGFAIFVWLIFRALKQLHAQSKSDNVVLKLLGMAMFSSLCGISVVLAFTAEISGLHVFWMLIGAAFLPVKAGQAKSPS